MSRYRTTPPAHRALAVGVVVVVAALGGCGRPTGAGGTGEALAAGRSPVIPTVQPTCAADYPWYESVEQLVDTADVVVRVTATGPTREDEVRSDPQEDGSSGLPGTALTARVTEVVTGDVAVGDVVEVVHNACTARPLPVGADADYVLALSTYGPGVPMGQLNDGQSAWQVGAAGRLHSVDPANDLGVTSLGDLVAAAAAVEGSA